MAFFDLNIPYNETSKPTKPNTRHKQTRSNLASKTMELGFTGIAYTRTLSGVMSDNDFCSISLLSLSSILSLSPPSFPSAVKLRRTALKVPLTAPFRQYTRLNVVVENAAQAAALNSGNPILRSYHLVAVRPMNMVAFEQACLVSEVDIISIDFSENKPFRMRQALVKTAIQRGLYFEIAYSDLLVDARTRRKVIDNAKLLVNWTGGKNLIFSSAAPSVNELRGPYDITNLMSCLLGVSMERAKEAISKNCRNLIANALRKKQCYKEAIRVEPINPDKQVDSKEPWYGDWLNYDPITSGEGDMLLEDMAKCFAASNKATKTVKAIDFTSIMNNLPPNGLKLKDLISGNNGVSEALINPPSNCISENSTKSFSPKIIPKDFRIGQEIGTHTPIIVEEPKLSKSVDVCFTPIEKHTHDLQTQDPSENNITMSMDVDTISYAPVINHAPLQDEAHEMLITDVDLGVENITMDGVVSEIESDDKANVPLASSSNLCLNNIVVEEAQVKDTGDEVLPADERLSIDLCDVVEAKDVCSITNYEIVKDVIMEDLDQGEDHTEIQQPTLDETKLGEQVNGLRVDEDGCSVANDEQLEGETTREQDQADNHTEISDPTRDGSISTSGKSEGKRRTPIRTIVLPFKRFLNPKPFKKKARKIKSKNKLI